MLKSELDVCLLVHSNIFILNCLFLVLTEVGQYSLAYLTAATHGFEKETQKLRAELESRDQPVPVVDVNAQLLVPPPPIQQMEENWSKM